MKTFRIGGIHPAPCKMTADSPATALPEPDVLTLLLGQSIGKPAKPLVKAGDMVTAGQLIAEADGLISANLHAPRAGKVSKIAKVRTQQGYWQDAIIIECDHLAPMPEFSGLTEKEVEDLAPAQIVEAVRNAGIVGLGGATFPTAVKLTPPQGVTIDAIIINGAECEPYLTCDDRLMRERARGIILGADLLRKAVNARSVLIGIEANKPEALAAMREANRNYSHDYISVQELKTKYPQGGEKQLIAALTGREVPSGKLPASVGVVVDNVATAYAVYDAIYNGKPLIERYVTVTGSSLSAPCNLIAPIGVSVDELLVAAGGLPEDGTTQVIAGGPMMGRAISETGAPSVKGTSGILVMTGDKVHKKPGQPCIRCGRCVHGCPMGLEPYLLIAQARHGLWQEMKENAAMDCIECGSCSWTCPSNKPLLDFIKLGKIEIRKQKL